MVWHELAMKLRTSHPNTSTFLAEAPSVECIDARRTGYVRALAGRPAS
jgi:hypothetical protein